MHNGKKTCSGKIPEPKKDENLILDLLGYYDIKEVITDIARGEADLDTLKAGASLIPVAKITKVPKVVKAIGNVGKTGFKKGKEGEKIAKSSQTKQTKAKNKEKNSSEELKKIYNSIKDSPKYPEGFQPRKNGTTRNTVKNKGLLEKLREIESGTWKKVYKDGYDAYGNEISIHYFQSESGRVFDVKVKPYWSN